MMAKRYLLSIGAVAVAALAFPSIAQAPFHAFRLHADPPIERVEPAPSCSDIGTQVTCTGEVVGLRGATFEITIEADGIAEVVCLNSAGRRVPGQDTEVTVRGTTDPLPTPRDRQYGFSVTTDEPGPLPPTPACPSEEWAPEIVDVHFTTATLTLLEDRMVSDRAEVPVS